MTKSDMRQAVIALVEDEEMDIRHFRRLAKKHGLTNPLEIFEDAETALSFLRRLKEQADRPPVLVITDINMPGMTGHELIEAMRADPDLASHVIFVVSTSDLRSDIERAYTNQVAGYIVKDSGGAALAESVQMLRHYCGSVTLRK